MQRYTVSPWDYRRADMKSDENGEYVRYDDAQAEIARLAPKPIKSLPGEFNLAEMFDAVEIDGEAYISLSQHVDSLERSLKVSTERDALKAERDQARAQIAVVIEKAAGACVPKKVKMSWGNKWTPSTKNPQSAAAQAARKQCHDAIRALTPDNAAKALNQMLKEAREQGDYYEGVQEGYMVGIKEAAEAIYNKPQGICTEGAAHNLAQHILALIKERNE